MADQPQVQEGWQDEEDLKRDRKKALDRIRALDKTVAQRLQWSMEMTSEQKRTKLYAQTEAHVREVHAEAFAKDPGMLLLDLAVHLGIARFVQEQAPCARVQWQLIARLALCNWHNLEATNRIAVGVASMLLWRLWRRLRHGTAQAQVVVARPRRWAAAGGSVGGVLVGRVWF